MKCVSRVGDLTIRVKKKKRIGPIHTGSWRVMEGCRPIAKVGSNSTAGRIITGNWRVYIGLNPVATNRSLCTKGRVLKGSNRVMC